MPFLPRLEPERNGAARETDESIQAIFEGAYCRSGHDPFRRVVNWLRTGVPVLCYVPGSCMRAAAEYIRKENTLSHFGKWQLYCEDHPGPNKADNWMNYVGNAIGHLSRLVSQQQALEPAIFLNLDRLFLDVRNEPVAERGTQYALFTLLESARSVPTLGLADRAFGPLPPAVEEVFAERIWLREVPPQVLVNHLIPQELATRCGWADTPGGTPGAWQVGQRLRWIDPLRAVRLMRAAPSPTSPGVSPAEAVANWIGRNTLPAQFESAAESFPGDPAALTGVEKETAELLRAAVVGPYTAWKAMGDVPHERYERELRMLPPGVIFHGPPGTGKTYLARWLAKSIDLPIRVVAGAELRDSKYGSSERNIVRLFQEARRAAPCVLVLDDADDLLEKRSEQKGSTASADRAIVNTILQELSGFGGRIPGVLVVLTTNRFDHLDEAVRSRVPLHVRVPYPQTDVQVGQLVDAVGGRYGYDLTAVRDTLVTRFFAPVHPQLAPPDRKEANENLFSPRDIEQAMLLLRNSSADGRISGDDVKRMVGYFESLPQPKHLLQPKKGN